MLKMIFTFIVKQMCVHVSVYYMCEYLLLLFVLLCACDWV